MRQQSKVQVVVRGTVIGGLKPLICLPLVGKSKAEVLEEARALPALRPDLLEWRIDACEPVESIHECVSLLPELRRCIGDIPLLFTCRIDKEGGLQKIAQDERLTLYIAAMESGHVDIVDVELCNGDEFIQTIKEAARTNNVKIILSYHNFHETPHESIIYSKLAAAQNAGADIAKLAVMPKNYDDVLTLLRVTNSARNETIQGPLVTISMGEKGAVSRLAGGLFGSDITFAVGLQGSASGQIPINELRAAMAVLYDGYKDCCFAAIKE